MFQPFKSLLTRDVTAFFIRRFSSFTYLNFTQFLGALNDNIYKFLVVFFLIQLQGIEQSGIILSITGAVFVIPFLSFSTASGKLADRFSKRNIIIGTKALELAITICSIAVFWFESAVGAYAILFMLATQSALFSPSKYGILPELVDNEKISKANGLMTMFTFLAIIIGTFFASFLLDITGKNFIIAAFFCSGLSLIGFLTSLCIEYTPPGEEGVKFNFFFLAEIYTTLKAAYAVPSLIAAILAATFFMFLGAYVQLNMIPFAMNALSMSDTQGGYLFLIVALGIGSGAVVSGKISGAMIELGIVPIAAFAITLSLYCLDFYSPDLWFVFPCIFSVGFLGGIYQVPLDSYIQVASPPEQRGQVIAATNFLSFLGVLLASLILFLLSEVFEFDAQKGFTVMGSITLIVAICILFQFFDYTSRFIGMILSKLHFKAVFIGSDQLPRGPVIYVCTHTAWNDTLLMLEGQRRRLRFYIEEEQEHSVCMKKLYKLLKIVNVPEPLETDLESVKEIKETLDRGVSVCIFVENPNTEEEVRKFCTSTFFKESIDIHEYPLISVTIEKGSKEKEPKILTRLLEKIHIPVKVEFNHFKV